VAVPTRDSNKGGRTAEPEQGNGKLSRKKDIRKRGHRVSKNIDHVLELGGKRAMKKTPLPDLGRTSITRGGGVWAFWEERVLR